MRGPTAVALDDVGNLYVADRLANQIRRIDPAGAMTTVAGSGLGHFTGNEISAVNAALNQPNGVAVDSKGNLYIADTPNNRVRRVAPSGIIGTVVGTGESGGGEDGGPATDADLSFPSGLAVGSDDSLYIADTSPALGTTGYGWSTLPERLLPWSAGRMAARPGMTAEPRASPWGTREGSQSTPRERCTSRIQAITKHDE